MSIYAFNTIILTNRVIKELTKLNRKARRRKERHERRERERRQRQRADGTAPDDAPNPENIP
jgi:rRNA-processing protein FCF1